MNLGDFLFDAANDRGPWNCSTLAADWCVALGHPDFAAEWREVVEADACETVPRQAGGLVALWDLGIADALPVVTDLMPGDIAVVTALGLEAGAIWTGEFWALRAARGIHFLAPHAVSVVKAWRP